MESNKGEESGEMYSPDDQGEYMPEAGTLSFSVQGLSDTLMVLDPEVTMVQPLSEEFALLLEVMMAEHPGHPHPPTFSWNVGMVMHILKGDPTLRDLEHVQVDGPGMAYLFFDKQGCRGLAFDATQTLRTHVGEAFAEWISHSVHFAVIPLPLVEGWCQAIAASEWCRQRSWAEYQGCPMPNLVTGESDSTPPLVGIALPSVACMGQTEESGDG